MVCTNPSYHKVSCKTPTLLPVSYGTDSRTSLHQRGGGRLRPDLRSTELKTILSFTLSNNPCIIVVSLLWIHGSLGLLDQNEEGTTRSSRLNVLILRHRKE